MRDEERSQVFDAHEDLAKAWRRFKGDPASERGRASLQAAVDRIQRLDVQLLQNMARQIGSREERDARQSLPAALRRTFWWERD